MMPNSGWSGDEKKDKLNQPDHDLLIRIDTNLNNLVKNFEESQDTISDQGKRLQFLEKVYWIGIGGVVVVQFIFTLILK